MAIDLSAALANVAERRGVSVEQLSSAAHSWLEQRVRKHFGDGPRWQVQLGHGRFRVGVEFSAAQTVYNPRGQVRCSDLAALGVDAREGDSFDVTVLSIPETPTSQDTLDLLRLIGVFPGRGQAFVADLERSFARELLRAPLPSPETTPTPLPDLSVDPEGAVRTAFASYVPELADGSVEILRVAFDPGTRRCKIAIRSNDIDIDAAGALVGMKGQRIQPVLRQLSVTVDLVDWHPDALQFVYRAIYPAVAERFSIDPMTRHVVLISPGIVYNAVEYPTEASRLVLLAVNLRLAEALCGYSIGLDGDVRFIDQATLA